MLGGTLTLSASILGAVINEQVVMKIKMAEGSKGDMAHRKIKILKKIYEI